MRLGASLFIRNGIKYDFCYNEAIESVLPICEEMVILECSSDDGTKEDLVARYSDNPKITLITDQKWDVAPDHARLAMLANIASSKLTTDWHFMMQADEVLHETSYDAIRTAVRSGLSDRYIVRRYNVWGNHDSYISFDSPAKPCSDAVCRLAKTYLPAVGDAESILPHGAVRDFMEDIKLVHYGFVRRGHILLDKCINMQTWFFGPSGMPDKRLYTHKEEGYFDPSIYGQAKHLKPLPFQHPLFMKTWLKEHKNDPTFKEIKL